jgi:hypothetical protein
MAEEIQITCELQTVGDSLTGRARRQDGEAREFTGWLGLLGALQALMADADAGGEPVPAPEPSR